MPGILSNLDVDRALEYLDFVVERHRVYERRQNGLPQNQWTDDPVLATRKFTQVFRWLDPGSQFVLTDLLPETTPTEALYRCTFYRYTNWPETWRWLRERLGHYPLPSDDQQHVLNLLRQRRDEGHQMFSGAYMIIPQPGRSGDKLLHVVVLTNQVVASADEFLAAPTQEEKHAVLCSHYGVGNFLGLQILTDYMYQFGNANTENEFVVAGPGSFRGAKVLAPGHSTVDVIRWSRDTLLGMSNCPSMGGHRPTTMDVQNTLCEYSKYVKGPLVNRYRPAHASLPQPTIPEAYSRVQ